jgi:hypothetical protein
LNTITQPKDIVPREFMGKARDLRRVLEAEDVIAWKEMGRISQPFACIGKGTIPRPQMLERAAVAWQERVPKSGRISLSIKRTKASLVIDEVRCGRADTTFAEWGPDHREPGFSLVAIRLEVAPPRFRYYPILLAGLSLHTIGRWFQRSFTCTHPALLSDLLTLAMGVTDEVLEAGGAFEIPAGAGKWSGVVMSNTADHENRVLAVRTFLTD